MNIKEILTILFGLFKIFRRAYAEASKKRNEKEIRDVRDALKNTDINKLRDSVLGD